MLNVCKDGVADSVLQKIELFKYDEGRHYCGVEDIDALISEEITTYWELSSAPDWKYTDVSLKEYVSLGLLGLVDKHVTWRHANYNKTENRDIKFEDVTEIF